MNTSIKLKHIALSTLFSLIAITGAFSQSVTILPKSQANTDTLSTKLFRMTNGAGISKVLVSDNAGNGRWTDTLSTTLFRMTNGAGISKVMVSDNAGNGTWTDPDFFTDTHWAINNTHLYQVPSGNVGIGTDNNPAFKLDVRQSTATIVASFSGSNSNGTGIRIASGISGTLGDFPISSEWQLFHSGTSISSENGGYGQLLFRDQNGTKMILRNNGRVGIGVLNPSEMLEVNGNARINGRIDIRNTGNGVFIGEEAGKNDDLSGNYNTFIGFYAGKANVGAGNNVAIGAGSLENNVSGNSNTAVGRLALVGNISGEGNVALGIYAGANAGGNNNIFLGANAGDNNISGSNNIFVGTQTGNNSSGSNNVFLGNGAGSNSGGSYNVFLGNRAGENEQGNDKLYIHNSNTTTPLIYGNFVERNLGVNGRLLIGAHTPYENSSKLDVLATNDARFIVQSWTPVNNALVVARLLSTTSVAPQLRFERTGNNSIDIGQDSNGSFVVEGGDASRMVVENTGQVGIGTATPESQLEIISTAKETLEAASSSTVGTWFSLKNSSVGGKKWHFISTGSANTEGSGSFLLKEDLTARMFIEKTTGEVGFGTVTPNAQLEVAGTVNETLRANSSSATGTWFSMLNTSTGGNNWKMISTGVNNSEGSGHLILKDNSGFKMIIKSNGAVGIGTDIPNKAKLVVDGNLSSNSSPYGYLNSSGSTGTSSGTNSYSIYTTHRIATSELNVYSDARIKKIKGLSDNANDLNILKNIQITDYQLIDSISKGNTNYKKVIAQQVEEVYPSAITKMTDFVPDIYQLSAMEKGFIPLTKTTLKAGDIIKLITDEKQEVVEVLNVSANGIKVNSEKSGKVFVYGKEVNDFRTVDYEALATLNISATQALLKRIEVLEKENQRINQLAQEVESLKNLILVSQKGK
jgi:hypothetical protein